MNTLTTELMHYGVMGMHWGVRRYQPYPAAYDGDGRFIGRKALKKQVKADKAKVDQLTKDTSILGAALTNADSRLKKLGKKSQQVYSKYGDNPIDYTQMSNRDKRYHKKLRAATDSKHQIEEAYKRREKELQDAVSELKKKYGNENVRDIVYKTDKHGNKVVNERVIEGKDWLTSIAWSAVSLGAARGIGAPFAVLFAPSGRAHNGNFNEWNSYMANKLVTDRQYDAYKPGEKMIYNLTQK